MQAPWEKPGPAVTQPRDPRPMDLGGSPPSLFIDPHVLPVPMFAFWEQMALTPPVMPGEGAAMHGRPDCSSLCAAAKLQAQPVLVICPRVLLVCCSAVQHAATSAQLSGISGGGALHGAVLQHAGNS